MSLIILAVSGYRSPIRSRLFAYLCALITGVLLILDVGGLAFPDVASAVSANGSPNRAELSLEKLQLEIDALREARARRFWQAGAFWQGATVAVALFALIANGWLQRLELKRQRRADNALRESDLANRYEDRFARMSEGLASGEGTRRAAAAALVDSFTGDVYVRRAHALLVSTLRLDSQADTSSRIVATAFSSNLRRMLPNLERGAGPPSELKMTEIYLHEADLAGLDLRVANLEAARMKDCDLRGAKLNGANLMTADLERVKAREAHLRGARFDYCDAAYGDFRRVEARGAIFDGMSGRAVNLSGSDLTRALLRDTGLADGRFLGADLSSARFDRAMLVGASFDGADLRGVVMDGARIERASFRGAMLDEPAKESLARAIGLESAYWDEAVLDDLLARRRGVPEGEEPD